MYYLYSNYQLLKMHEALVLRNVEWSKRAAYEVEHIINDMYMMYIICYSLETACYFCASHCNLTLQERANGGVELNHKSIKNEESK